MKKIGILTYHNNTNRGSILQAYCLWRAVKKKINNATVEIIDYRTLSKEIQRLYTINPRVFIKKILDFSTCTNFFKKHNALSSNKIITNNYKKSIDFLEKQGYDMIIVGSDVVWRIEQEGGFPPTSRPFPNAYFLNPYLDTIKVSYAASTNITDLRSLPKEKIDKMRNYLSSFDKITVRDRHTKEFLQGLGISNVAFAPDPTLLVDIPQIDGRKLLESHGISLDKPILATQWLGKLDSTIKKYFKGKDYQIVSLDVSRNTDFELWGKLNPIEYYSAYKNFDMVITSSFHSTLFSLKQGIPFATLDYSPKQFEYKTESVLREFSSLERNIKISTETPKKIMDRIKVCESKLEKKHVKKITSMKKKGFAYIQSLGGLLDAKKIQ